MSSELSPLQRAFLALEETRARLAALEERQREPIAVIGIGCRLPGGISSPLDYWALLQDERSGVSTVPPERWDHASYFDPVGTRPGTTYAQHAGFVETPVDAFDAAFFGISPREAAAMDPQQRLLLEVAWEALEHAGIAPDRLEGSATGVFVGLAAGDYAQLQQRGGALADIDAHYATGIAHSIASGRISYVLGLRGPSLSIDTACSSSLVAVHLACQSLRARDCDMALSAGVNLILSPESFIAFARTHMLAADGRCKPFDVSADGFVRGEGCGVVVLKRLSDARRDGDRVLGVIRGSAVNQDGASASLTAPSGPAQEGVIRRALHQAALQPGDVQYVEAHGTGTTLGDPIELRALGAVYGATRDASSPLVVGSVKANLGHLEGAAGVASLVKAILTLDASHIPGQLHLSVPTPLVDWSGLRLRPPARGGEAWPHDGVRRAAVSSFGFSGTNAHVIVEQAPPTAHVVDVPHERPVQIIPIAGRSTAAVRTLAAAWAPYVLDVASLRDVAHTAAVGRAQLTGARAAVVAVTSDDARAALAAIADGAEITTSGVGTVARAAFLFTGQGSQSAGMARELYEAAPTFRDSIHASAAVLADEWRDVSLLDVLYGADSEHLLSDARHVQPAIVAVELALAALWRSWGVEPAVVAGHSLGEYAAAAVAGVMTEADALRLVAARGRLMAELPAADCAMTSVSASMDRVRAALGSAFGSRVELAADNGPALCVLTGLTADIAWAEAELRARLGVECRRLVATTNAFHSRHIEPMLDAFERVAASITFSAPGIPVSWNLGRDVLAPHRAPDAAYWRRQTRGAVQFGDAIALLRERDITHAIEIGPHPVLAGIVAAADDARLPTGLASLRRGRGDWATLASAVAQWWTAGGMVDWVRFDAPYARRTIALPTYPFARERHWVRHASVSASRRDTTVQHALVGARLSSPAIPGAIFERELSALSLPLLDQHRIHGRAILPGAAWLDAFTTVASRVNAGAAHSLVGLTLHAPLHVPDDRPRVLQVIVSTDAAGVQRLTGYSRAAADVDDAWTLHADAWLEPAVSRGAPRSVTWPEHTASGADALYDRLEQVGLRLGPEFRLVARIERHDGKAKALIDASRAGVWIDGIVHPTILDACIQSIALAVASENESDKTLYMPLAVDRFDWYGPTPETLLCEATLRPGSPGDETLGADVIASDADGRVVGRLSGVTLKRASRDALRLVDCHRVRDAMYDLQWEAAPLRAGAALPLPTIVARVEAQGPLRAAELSLGRYASDGPRMDRIATLYIWRALASLGAGLVIGDVIAPTALARRLRVEERHVAQFGRLLQILAEDGVLHSEASQYRVAVIPDASRIDALVCELQEGDGTPFSGELNLLARCGDALAAALVGDVDPLALLFPNGSLDDVHRIYRDSPFPRTYNALVRDAVETLMASRDATERPLRILEVGGGTGGTTAAVLDAIPDGECEYVFTDASPLFLGRAQERFAHRTGMAYRVYDLERDAASQGVAPLSFDLIVGANVIHATRDVGHTLTALHTLLAPGGMLMMLEMSRPARWVDLSFGFTEGWWLFADAFRTTYPLLDSGGWRRALESAGFAEIAVALGTAGSGDGLEEQSMVFARRATGAMAPAQHWVVLADDRETGQALATRLGQTLARLVLKPADGPWERAQLVRELEAIAAESAVTGVACLLRHDVGASQAYPSDAAANALDTAVSALAVSQAVLTFAHDNHGAQPRLTFVTHCAVRVDTSDEAPSPAQATVVGLLRSLQLEHPELAATGIDLPRVFTEFTLDALARELLAPPAEPQVALRGSSRLVARIDHASIIAPAFPRVYCVVPRERGVIESLGVCAGALPTPRRGDVVIRVAATGLNFKDVLNVLGMYPGDAGPLGGECAGYVVATGDESSGFRIGQRVVAIAAAALGSHVSTRAELVAPVPEHMALDTAAALPIAYLTAQHALIELGRLTRGERVLIHAGAGGVGLAAVHIALRAGAEVFATAGSESKRALLRTLGVYHVFDSRTADFTEQILAVTNGVGVHVTLNSLADAFVERSLAATARDGRFLEIGKRGIWTPDAVAALGKQLTYHIVDWTDLARTEPARIGAMLRDVLGDVARGDLPPLPIEVFPLSRVHDAFRWMAQGRHTGKIVVSHRAALDASGAQPVSIMPGAAYVVAGGTSGIGLLAAEWLADRGATHLVLCSRSAGTDATHAAVSRLHARGMRVDVESVDVSDAAALGALLDRVRGTAQIRGVIQSAGRLDDAAVLQLDAARVATVFSAKVAGSVNLDLLTHDDPLDFFVCFASVAGLLGSAGQANHAAANTFIDALVQRRRSEGRPGVSIDWGAWDTVGAAVRRGVLSRAASIGVQPITPDDGCAALDAIFAGSAAQIAVLPVDWQVFARTQSRGSSPVFARVMRAAAKAAPRRGVADASAAVIAASVGSTLMDDLAGTVLARRSAVLRTYLRTRIAKTLGLSDGTVVDDRQPLRDVGLDSLLAIELRNVLGTAIGRALPATLLFDYPTIDDLAPHLLTTLFPDEQHAASADATTVSDASAGALARDLSTMSDDDVDRLFAERMKRR